MMKRFRSITIEFAFRFLKLIILLSFILFMSKSVFALVDKINEKNYLISQYNNFANTNNFEIKNDYPMSQNHTEVSLKSLNGKSFLNRENMNCGSNQSQTGSLMAHFKIKEDNHWIVKNKELFFKVEMIKEPNDYGEKDQFKTQVSFNKNFDSGVTEITKLDVPDVWGESDSICSYLISSKLKNLKLEDYKINSLPFKLSESNVAEVDKIKRKENRAEINKIQKILKTLVSSKRNNVVVSDKIILFCDSQNDGSENKLIECISNTCNSKKHIIPTMLFDSVGQLDIKQMNPNSKIEAKLKDLWSNVKKKLESVEIGEETKVKKKLESDKIEKETKKLSPGDTIPCSECLFGKPTQFKCDENQEPWCHLTSDYFKNNKNKELKIAIEKLNQFKEVYWEQMAPFQKVSLDALNIAKSVYSWCNRKNRLLSQNPEKINSSESSDSNPSENNQ